VILTDNQLTHMAEADIFKPDTVLRHPNATSAPGLVACHEWWPDGPLLKTPSLAAQCIARLVARKS
jgi:hypothetical protein